MKITKRSILLFCAAVLAIFIVEVISDWNNNIAAFKKGYKEGYHPQKK